MDFQEFASILNGRQYGHEITKDEEKLAKELGLVVVFGYSDDNTEFRGAINDEAGCFKGKEIYLDKNGVFEECECECKYSESAKKECKVIKAVWHDIDDFAWTYETDMPYATFEIFEDDEPYCRGIVFDIISLI